jgi:ABC-type multidrug transport system fused ATPase/permease subunit
MALVGAVLAPQLFFVPLLQYAINQRVSRRITLMRLLNLEISAGTVVHPKSEHDKLDTIFDLSMDMFRLKFSLKFLMNLTCSSGLVGVLCLGGWLVVRGQTDVATVVTFASALTKIIDPWNDLVDWWRSLAVSSTKYELIAKEFQRLQVANRRP